jgi:Flp pilus assembly protein TadG
MAAFPRLVRDNRGAAAIEFAVVAPVLLLLMMGMFDLGYNIYTDAQLEGSVQEAARASTIEGAEPRAATIDARVTTAVHHIAPQATIVFDRKAYASFSDVSQPEDFTDTDGNGACNAGEPFEDVNGNGTWDTDRGMNGQGGARDATLYTVQITYPRPFPVARLIGQSGTFSLTAKTVLRNQPYNLQAQTIVTANCT